MTALRPERESDPSYGQQPYEGSGTFGEWYGVGAQGPPQEPYAAPYAAPVVPQAGPSGPAGVPYEPAGDAATAYAPPAPHPGPHPGPPAVDEETMALRIPDPPPEASSATGTTEPPTGGRAARRKAARRRHGRRGAVGEAVPEGGSPAERPSAPLSRVEARRQARARRASPGVVASRIIGEVFITTGVVMLLFVTYQLWWTNVRAHAQAGSEANQLQNEWASGKRNPGAFEPGQGFALLHIPKLDVVVPVAEGISKSKVLDKGMVGHYAEGALNTAMPEAKTGNFGLAGHRNTHGEPFRYINRLSPGDAIVVETQDTYFVYKMASMLPVTPPANTSVLDPVPKGSGFTKPGRYITLTTCTPEFTSKYRLIVWGKMVEERPRSKGKPDALVS
ncbi:class E sortase [Streptomyces sp. NTH33]|uniref:class E sortase n=1 Tax=Streptomyces sp. NTH33 TaxID=1735453 RepID=UPI000DAA5447|nr:class E sortase [Streptomyces sp. NTH33]PZH06867.1 class E sortase [Streptomyces sp. NTH33]